MNLLGKLQSSLFKSILTLRCLLETYGQVSFQGGIYDIVVIIKLIFVK